MKISKQFKLLFAVITIAGMTLSSCSNEEFSTDESLTQEELDQTKNPLANVTTSPGWMDSFEVNGKCYCRSTYDHGIGNYKVNGRTVRSICEEMKSAMQQAWNGPGKKTLYNTVQCGHKPAHDDKTIQGQPDEILCPGEVGNGIKCNSRKGPKWDLGNDNGGNNKAPNVSFAAPANNASMQVGYNDLYVKVNASDSDGSIAEVRLYIDDKFIRRERVDPYEWGQGGRTETLGLSAGTHTLKAIARDNDGAEKTATRTITVTSDGGGDPGNGISVSFASPANNTSLKVGYANLYVKANASDANGNITEVSLYIDNKFIRTERFDPYEWGHNNNLRNETRNLGVGSHTFRVVAKDNQGNESSSTMTVNVTN